jgi:FlaA1/EpsC-like NDP-sugar epimerase
MFPKLHIVPRIADVCDESRIDSILLKYRPSFIFHAAAHKHVPMMEWNPGEAVKNNVLGTRTVARLAAAHHVAWFVMISTDKAVNPSSVMGVSKRVAELYIQALAQHSATRFMTVRFGNVLGSAGSVIPTFQRQIAAGGPVTVTHPEMRRFFMTIPEACQLVLQAAGMGRGGELFILDMGEPVKIVDLARQMIRLAGLKPDKEVKIEYIGLRPGEKLYEELFHANEPLVPTDSAGIRLAAPRTIDYTMLSRSLDELGEHARERREERMMGLLATLVPEFASSRAPAPRVAGA